MSSPKLRKSALPSRPDAIREGGDWKCQSTILYNEFIGTKTADMTQAFFALLGLLALSLGANALTLSRRHRGRIGALGKRLERELGLESGALRKSGRDREEAIAERVAAIVAESRGKDAFIVAQSRHAALGGLVSHLSHQWRQPLNVLGLVFQAFQMQSESGDLDAKAIDAYVLKGLDEIQSLNHLLDEYRKYYRPENDEGDFPIRGLIESGILLQSPAIEALRVKTSIDCPPDLELWGRHGALREILVAIIGGSLAAFAARTVSGPEISFSARANPDGSIAIKIRDNAGGIPESMLDGLFDADFPGGNGGARTGLFACRLIVERSLGGGLAAANEAGGLAFDIRLPGRIEA